MTKQADVQLAENITGVINGSDNTAYEEESNLDSFLTECLLGIPAFSAAAEGISWTPL